MSNVKINKKRVEQSFRKSISTYNQHATVQNDICEKLINELIKHCGNSFNQIFEFGAGTGLLTDKIVKKLNVKKLFLNDLVSLMKTPLSTICDSNLNLKTTYVMGDAESLDIIPNNDLIISASTVQWFDNLKEYISANILQGLNSNGIFAFSTFGPQNMIEIGSIEGNSLQYLTITELENILATHFDILSINEEFIPLFFKTPKDVLNHIKQTGVNGIESKKWTKIDLLQFTNSYEIFNSDKGYILTYHPISVICRKK